MTWSIYIQPALLQSRGFARGRGWMGWVLPVCHTSQRFHPWAAHSQLSYTVGISKGTWKLDSGSHQLALVQVFTPPCWVREQQKVWSQLSVCSELLKILNIHSSLSVSTTPIKNDLRIKETAMLFSVTWLDFDCSTKIQLFIVQKYFHKQHNARSKLIHLWRRKMYPAWNKKQTWTAIYITSYNCLITAICALFLFSGSLSIVDLILRGSDPFNCLWPVFLQVIAVQPWSGWEQKSSSTPQAWGNCVWYKSEGFEACCFSLLSGFWK